MLVWTAVYPTNISKVCTFRLDTESVACGFIYQYARERIRTDN